MSTKPNENESKAIKDEGRQDVHVYAPPVMGFAFSEPAFKEFTKKPTSLKTVDETGLAVVQEAMKEIVTNTSAISKNLPGIIQRGLDQVQLMFWIQFSVGIILFIVAIAVGVAGFNQLLAVVVGTTGGITLITTLVTTPPTRLQNNRVALSQRLIAYQGWYDALSVISAFMTEEAKLQKLDFIRFQTYNDYLLQT